MLATVRDSALTLAAQGPAGLQEAIALLERELPDWERDFYLGYFCYQLGAWSRAAGHLETALPGNPNNPDTYLLLGLALAETEPGHHKAWAIRRDYTRKAMEQAERMPEPTAWNNLQYCLETLATASTYVGPSDYAEYAYRWLIRIDPNNAKHYEELSNVLADDNLEESVALLERAHHLNPRAETSSDLKFVRETVGQKAESQKATTRRAKYPTTEQMSGPLREVIRQCLLENVKKDSFVRPETRFFTLGSCFAREIAKRLGSRGYGVNFFEVSEHINSTYANRHMMEWAFERCSGQPKERLDELFSSLGLTPEILRNQWRSTDVLVYTLGVAPVFFDRKTGQFIMPKSSSINSRALAEAYEFRTTTVAENLDNLESIRAGFLELNPNIKFVVTVSPVPLRMTFEFFSAIYADCISKSTLRVVAHEFAAKFPEVIYWPSFEVVRWIGGHVGPYFGNDDGASLHVGDEVVSAITDSFIEHFS